MKKKRIKIAFVLFFGLIFFDNCFAMHIGVISKNHTPIYEYPNTYDNEWRESQRILFELNIGVIVNVLEGTSPWYKIEYDNKRGWVAGENINQAIVHPQSIKSFELGKLFKEISIKPILTSKIEKVNFCMPSWSPNGKTIAVIMEYYHLVFGDGWPKQTDSSFLCLLDTKSNKINKVFKGEVNYPRWSSDGSKLLFNSWGTINYLDIKTNKIIPIVKIQQEEYGPYLGDARWINDEKVAYLISYYESFGKLHQYSIENQNAEEIGGYMQDFIVIKNGQMVFGFNQDGEYSDGVSASLVDLQSKKAIGIPWTDLPLYDKNPVWNNDLIKVFNCSDMASYNSDSIRITIPTQVIYSLNDKGQIIDVVKLPDGLFNRYDARASKWSDDGRHIVSKINGELWLISLETLFCEEIPDYNNYFSPETIDYTNRLPFCWAPDNKQIVYCLNNSIYNIVIK